MAAHAVIANPTGQAGGLFFVDSDSTPLLKLVPTKVANCQDCNQESGGPQNEMGDLCRRIQEKEVVVRHIPQGGTVSWKIFAIVRRGVKVVN